MNKYIIGKIALRFTTANQTELPEDEAKNCKRHLLIKLIKL